MLNGGNNTGDYGYVTVMSAVWSKIYYRKYTTVHSQCQMKSIYMSEATVMGVFSVSVHEFYFRNMNGSNVSNPSDKYSLTKIYIML